MGRGVKIAQNYVHVVYTRPLPVFFCRVYTKYFIKNRSQKNKTFKKRPSKVWWYEDEKFVNAASASSVKDLKVEWIDHCTVLQDGQFAAL